ncbi:hypothetical protein [Streptomyces flavochromogenes]|uniref:hypothetical protein n=1 Tax=Streptomyces flavochromogenes TaxID=68199 RepID=UPI0004BFC0D0|nr:hypothetical protein [Streptomyces flavochromogenes]
MIPRTEYPVSSRIPEEAEFWMPTEEDIPDDEGIGAFRGVWMILGVTSEEARTIVSAEAAQIAMLAELASSESQFEEIARACDTGVVDGVQDEGIRRQLLQRIPSFSEGEPEDFYADLGDLEVGVAGLAYALSYIGAVPVASCRGHVSERPWAENPVVFAAVDRPRAEWLEPLLDEAGCGFHIDPSRPEFLVIDAPSVVESNALAKLIVDRFDGMDRFDRWLDLSVL